MLKIEKIESSLHPRIWTFNRETGQPAPQILLLTDGTGESEAGKTRLSFEGPALAWLAESSPGRLRIEAGATGVRGAVPATLVSAAIGGEAESPELAALAERSFALSLAGHAEQLMLVERCMNAMLGELRGPQAGSTLMLSALLRIVMVAALRVSGGSFDATPATGEASVLIRFRQLVEINFRNRWSIARYADTLGVSTDRLHSLCTAGTGKSPKALVSERLAQEAAVRLERSSITIQRLGHALGFNDQAHFSNFFRRMTGVAPSAYRRARAEAATLAETRPAVSFAEWP